MIEKTHRRQVSFYLKYVLNSTHDLPSFVCLWMFIMPEYFTHNNNNNNNNATLVINVKFDKDSIFSDGGTRV